MIAAIVVAMLAAVGDSPAVNTVAKVDLERYLDYLGTPLPD